MTRWSDRAWAHVLHVRFEGGERSTTSSSKRGGCRWESHPGSASQTQQYRTSMRCSVWSGGEKASEIS
jgi:hypothetical protein